MSIPQEYIPSDREIVKQCEYICLEAKFRMIQLDYIVTNVNNIIKNPYEFTLQLVGSDNEILSELQCAGNETMMNYVIFELSRWIEDRVW